MGPITGIDAFEKRKYLALPWIWIPDHPARTIVPLAEVIADRLTYLLHGAGSFLRS